MVAADLPPILIFRYAIFVFYFVILAVAAFSFSPGLVLWSGVDGSIGCLAAFFWITGGMESPLQWTDIPANATPEQYFEIILSPNFAGLGSRIQECLILLLVAYPRRS
ncbi:MAG: hypothetical protein CL569_14940 [Alphaproteobacteria bacterium]|nr:hypothetical protein [Alphaproteobacteria bacterium]|tara:strand:+ start:348 stop:671 length:324 start_codon:yes stop_codon:yes gene_type:complete